jgi:hypothetical protein
LDERNPAGSRGAHNESTVPGCSERAVSTNDWSESMRKLLASLAAAAALGIAAATMSAAAIPNSPATDADVVASGSFGSGQAYFLLPYIEQDNIYRQF